MKERVFKNYVTTVLGLLLILVSIVSTFLKVATFQEASGWMALGVVFLRSKDSLISLPAKG